MADFFLDHGAYGTVTNRIGLDAPTWGVPQEGDGFSTGAASASAVAEIQILAAPTAAETIVIAGATITAGAAAAANVFVRGATAAACATNIVTLINSANFTNVVSGSVVLATGIATASNQGRNLFYARIKPATTDTVQIMWRVGSAALNHAANSAVAITSASWASAPTITQFIGGTSGCWGWLVNPAALGQGSSIALGAYGVLMSRPTIVRSGAGSTVGTLSIIDRCWLRTASGKQIVLTLAGNILRNNAAPDLTYIADTNTKWTGDSGTGVLDLRLSNTSTFANAFSLSNAVNGKVKITALMKGGFKISGFTTGNSTTTVCVGTTNLGEVTLDNLTLEEDATSTGSGGTYFIPQPQGTLNVHACVTRCVLNYLRASTTGRTMGNLGIVSFQRSLWIKDCEFNFNYTGVSPPSAPLFTVTGGCQIRAVVSNCKLTGLGSYTQKLYGDPSGGWSGNLPVELIGENVVGSDVGANGLAPWYAAQAGYPDAIRKVFVSNPNGSWRYEIGSGAADWVEGAGFPTLAGLKPGGSAQSVRWFWLPTPTGQSITRGWTSPALRRQSRGATGTKTLTLELLLPSAITYDAFNTLFEVAYISGGVPYYEMKTGADLVASAASWTNAGSYPGHAAQKLTFTTAHAVDQYSEVFITATLIGDCPTGALQYLFADPAWSLT